MSSFQTITPECMTENIFKSIGRDWFLITAAAEGKINTMTASWGGFGIMWGKPVAYIVVRETRYTKVLLDKANTFSLSFFNPEFKKTLGYLGSVSGRDEDKVAASGLTVVNDEIPYFEEAKLVLKAKTLYKQDMKPECFLDPELPERWYANGNFHTLYVAELSEVLQK